MDKNGKKVEEAEAWNCVVDARESQEVEKQGWWLRKHGRCMESLINMRVDGKCRKVDEVKAEDCAVDLR